jgi:putative component of membrane protein insertase Oxa1/YidC/SpoIIIJ protein YidD
MRYHPAVLALAAYQRWISPWKGFRCAHRVFHGGSSCSEFARAAIVDAGLLSAWPRIRVRLAGCRRAYASLRSNGAAGGGEIPAAGEEGARRRRSRRRTGKGRFSWCSPSDLPFMCDAPCDIGPCDVTPDG